MIMMIGGLHCVAGTYMAVNMRDKLNHTIYHVGISMIASRVSDYNLLEYIHPILNENVPEVDTVVFTACLFTSVHHLALMYSKKDSAKLNFAIAFVSFVAPFTQYAYLMIGILLITNTTSCLIEMTRSYHCFFYSIAVVFYLVNRIILGGILLTSMKDVVYIKYGEDELSRMFYLDCLVYSIFLCTYGMWAYNFFFTLLTTSPDKNHKNHKNHKRSTNKYRD